VAAGRGCLRQERPGRQRGGCRLHCEPCARAVCHRCAQGKLDFEDDDAAVSRRCDDFSCRLTDVDRAASETVCSRSLPNDGRWRGAGPPVAALASYIVSCTQYHGHNTSLTTTTTITRAWRVLWCPCLVTSSSVSRSAWRPTQASVAAQEKASGTCTLRTRENSAVGHRSANTFSLCCVRVASAADLLPDSAFAST
jgi:hypothetical protein